MDHEIDNLEIENLPWYHPTLSRHTAESMLIQNGMDGTYLLRPSSKGTGEYALSVKCEQTVKHFNIVWTGMEIRFGQCTFNSAADFVEHFKNKPLLCGESGQVVLLKIPYPRDISEPDMYESVTLHAEFSTADDSQVINADFSVNSKEGFLTKLGRHFKTWRTRWFVLQRNELKYYKQKFSKTPIRVLDLKDCRECCRDTTQKDKSCVFRLDMGNRVFLLYSVSEHDMDDWIKRINWRLRANRTRGSINSGNSAHS
ncbi:dual adapter for phosphotyrosine and 3-phosphotyrosine and 3-phosphoinositide-like [Physella acuta]|uniref:dual adapter for phosphotyrosine and 3-phosphotyrosine and 3-phosphoinositide-like n=1 Tax=Physella acuta TaxID=109671 RepID=UPI0027DB2F02|nr:dual adapter for phosphotyrosine and 3-phosphotyrosine and 3-phosphoinositide-like [Physella acuta]XP_059179068.1 dual adapter for phosphotyrosine and 3-phosphotyrosine and 3-phosphoinositide-like [Physella acuta]